MGENVEDMLGRERADELRKELGMIVDCIGVRIEGADGRKIIRTEMLIRNSRALEEIDDNAKMLERIIKIEILEMREILMRMLVGEGRSLGICFSRYMPKDRIELNHETYMKLMKAAPELVGRLESLLEK